MNKNPNILVVTGVPGSNKRDVLRKLAHVTSWRAPYQVVHMGKAIADELPPAPFPPSENQAILEEQREARRRLIAATALCTARRIVATAEQPTIVNTVVTPRILGKIYSGRELADILQPRGYVLLDQPMAMIYQDRGLTGQEDAATMPELREHKERLQAEVGTIAAEQGVRLSILPNNNVLHTVHNACFIRDALHR